MDLPRFTVDSVMPLLPIIFIIGAIWSVVAYMLFSIINGVMKGFRDLATLNEKRYKASQEDKQELEALLSAQSQEQYRMWRMHQYDLERVKNHVGFPSPLITMPTVKADNIVNVSQETESTVLEKFSTQIVSDPVSEVQ